MTYVEEGNLHFAYYQAKRIADNAQSIRDCGLMDAEEEEKERKALKEMERIESEWKANGGR